MQSDGYLIGVGEFGTVERDTLQCCHCNKHYIVQPGSGKRRGWCFNCASTTCGEEGCIPCIPFEKKLEAFEAREAALRSYGLV